MQRVSKRRTRANNHLTPSWTTSRLESRLLLAGDLAVAAEVASQTFAPAPVSSSDSAQAHATNSIVFIDGSLEAVDELINGTAVSSELVLLDPSIDFVDQISSVLESRSRIDSIHIVTHGRSGQLLLGNQNLGVDELQQRQLQIKSWSNALSAGGDILLYGCNSGQGDEGHRFVSLLAELTGADVAASSDITGSPDQDADWILEKTVGRIDAAIAFNNATQQDYAHTFVIKVNARGETGEEQFDLLVDGDVLASWNASTTDETYVYDGPHGAVGTSAIRVRFNNDLYQPENGFDRNLFVSNVIVDGVILESEFSYTSSSGTWKDSDGITFGYGRGETLHANGEFVYAARQTTDNVFGGAPWIATTPAANVSIDIRNQSLNLTSAVDSAMWHGREITGGSTYQFTVEGARGLLGNDTPPYASVGIDFRDAHGNEIGERSFDLSAELKFNQVEFVAPENATNATIWAWVGDSPPGTSTQLILKKVELTEVDFSDDTTPPTASLQSDSADVTIDNSSISFIVDYQDNVRLSSTDNPTLRVTGPNGYDQTTVTFTGGGNGVTNQFLLHGIFAEGIAPIDGGRSWGPQDNGTYTVTLLGNTLLDQAGNAAPEQVLGTFELLIPSESDQIPPTAILLTQNATINQNGEVQFLLQYEDNEAQVRFVNAPGDAISITGPNGYQASANGFAGGPGEGSNQTIEAFVLPPGTNGYEPGEYFVTINDNHVMDVAGNLLASRLLGSFFLTLPS